MIFFSIQQDFFFHQHFKCGDSFIVETINQSLKMHKLMLKCQLSVKELHMIHRHTQMLFRETFKCSRKFGEELLVNINVMEWFVLYIVCRDSQGLSSFVSIKLLVTCFWWSPFHLCAEKKHICANCYKKLNNVIKLKFFFNVLYVIILSKLMLLIFNI